MLTRSVHSVIGRALVAAGLGIGGCATSGSLERCLQTPVSSKVATADVTRCQTALQSDLDRRDVYQHIARLLLAKGRYSELVESSHAVLSRDERRMDAVYYLAVGLRKLGRCTDAVPFYRLYAQQHPDDPDPHYAVGLCLETMRQSAQARQAYAKYLELEKRPAFVGWRSKASARLTALDGPGHKDVARPSAAARPIALAGPSGGSSTGAEKTKSSATRPPTSPRSGSPRSGFGAGTAAATTPRPETATAASTSASPTGSCTEATSAVARDPFATPAYEQLAACLRARAEHQKIVGFMRTALRDNPDWSRGWLHLGRAQKALGQAQAAASALRKACEGGVSEACQR